MTEPTTLYRIYGPDTALLYVGVARNWPNRMIQHAAEKAWWCDVVSVATEPFTTRALALAAERAAIQMEHPRHNIVHNGSPRTRDKSPTPDCQPSLGMPLRRDQVVALGLINRNCPVGIIETADEEWVSLTLYKWAIETFRGRTIAVRITDIERIEWADWKTGTDGITEFWMDPLGDFQTRWNRPSDEPAPLHPVR